MNWGGAPMQGFIHTSRNCFIKQRAEPEKVTPWATVISKVPDNGMILTHTFRHLRVEGRRQKMGEVKVIPILWQKNGNSRHEYTKWISPEWFSKESVDFCFGLDSLLWKPSAHCLMEETEETESSHFCWNSYSTKDRIVVCHLNIIYC
jgi:hypothetical protein